MKRVTVLFILISSFVSAHDAFGQPSVSWSKTKVSQGCSMKVLFDYEKTKYKGLSYTDYCIVDKDFSREAIKEADNRFFIKLNERFRNSDPIAKRAICLTISGEPDCTIIVRPKSFDDNGSFHGDIVIIDSNNQIIGSLRNVSSYGGIHGSFINLIGDAYEGLAEVLEKEISSALRSRKL